MHKWLIILAALSSLISQTAAAQTSKMTPEEILAVVNRDFLTEDTIKATDSLRSQVNYVAENYEEAQLKRIIRNMEEMERKASRESETLYVPYDRRINVKKPDDVKRFFRKRIKTIY
ncbi:MAG: hypothetical protein IJ529_02560 [Alphaproteobacteria bacterium]|nr:hypothetical protein [Alphaproteobacteria bacterium]